MAQFIKIYPENPNPKAIRRVVDVLEKGGLIIYPTDTVYGLAGSLKNSKALERMASLKKVKLEKARFSFVCHDLSNLSDYVKQIAVGIRVPDNSIALAIVNELGNPLVSISIRDEDAILEYTTDPELILEKWGRVVDLVIDGGYGDNEGSTVIDFSGEEPMVIREGKGSLDIF
jgi:tRNA A37 threonylcarbamoyladenosine synthetase subunit TsaC/SUA5/YrdC